uniref:Uncharacterized protein n=1 Tax=Laticauda laticaudata TaxID=8630 RepID=A0A8C5SIX4_LATLA
MVRRCYKHLGSKLVFCMEGRKVILCLNSPPLPIFSPHRKLNNIISFSIHLFLFSFSCPDGVFGKCQQVPVIEINKYEISPSTLHRLRIVLEKLLHRGMFQFFNFQHLYFTPSFIEGGRG